MRLYYSSGSCSLSPHILVHESGLPVEIEKVVMKPESRTTEPHGENYFDINPRGYVPALKLDSGEVMTEGVAIAIYLADQAKGSNLLPEYQSMNYYRALEWMTYVSSELHKGFSPFFRKDLPESEAGFYKDRLLKRFEYLEKSLAGKSFLVGEQFTIADAYCFAIVRWHPKAQIDLAQYPELQRYFESLKARPAVQKAMREQGIE